MRLVPLFALLAFATPAFAQDAQTDKPKEEKKICHFTTTTGSILGGKRECHTKAEWKEISARNQASASRLLDNRRSGNIREN